MQPKILDRRSHTAGYLSIDRLKVQLADGATVWREVERHGDAAVVLPYDAQRRCALVVRLFRAPVFDVCGEVAAEEACAGMIEDGERRGNGAPRSHGGTGRNARLFGAGRPCLVEPGRLNRAPVVVPRALWSCRSQRRAAVDWLPSTRESRSSSGRSGARARCQSSADTDAKLVILVLALQLRRPDLFA